jgi:hypothetical protein
MTVSDGFCHCYEGTLVEILFLNTAEGCSRREENKRSTCQQTTAGRQLSWKINCAPATEVNSDLSQTGALTSDRRNGNLSHNNSDLERRVASSGMLCRVVLVRTDVSEERSASFIRVKKFVN